MFGLYQNSVTRKNLLRSSSTDEEQGPQQLCSSRRGFLLPLRARISSISR
jgi:hypothetical protein